jgi:hypothetical protein
MTFNAPIKLEGRVGCFCAASQILVNANKL